jgi:hypothetical protein
MRQEHHEGVMEQTSPSGVCDEPKGKVGPSEERRSADLRAGEQVQEKKEGSHSTETASEEPSRLFSQEETARFRSRWDTIQTGFVDEPQRAVKQADGLVTEVINRLAQVFAEERAKLEAQFDQTQNRGQSTEDLRLALRHYRAFFGRLLAV